MVDIKPGSRLKVGSETVTVETVWNQGHHRVFKLTDGRVMRDLHKRADVTGVESEIALGRTRRSEPRDCSLEVEPEDED